MPTYMENDYSRLIAQGVVNFNSDLHPVEENEFGQSRLSVTSPSQFHPPESCGPLDLGKLGATLPSNGCEAL